METIRVSRHPDGVAEIMLNRPEAMNSVSTAMAGELTRACTEIAGEPAVRAVVLSAAGERAFCAGADLKERAGMTDADILRQRHAIRATFGAVLALPQPAIAAVHGFALGGGCELALSCDLVVADDTATFGLPEVTVGLVPGGGGTQLALRRLGYGRAADLVLTGRRVGIDEAERLGLLDRRVPAGQDGPAALELAGQIAANSPVAVRAAKRAIRHGWGVSLEAGLDVEDAAWRTAALSADRREGIAAFVEKRRPGRASSPGPLWPPVIGSAGLLRDFHRAHPDTELDVVTLFDADSAIAAVRSGTIDASFRAVTRPARELPEGVQATRVFDEPVQLLVGPSHELATARAVTPAGLAGYRIWMPGIVAGTEWAAFYDELAAAFGLTIDPVGPNFGTEPLLEVIADAPALATFVGEQTRLLWPADYDLRRVAVRDPTAVYPHSLVWRSDNPHPALTVLRAYFGATSPGYRDAATWTPPWAQRSAPPRQPGGHNVVSRNG